MPRLHTTLRRLRSILVSRLIFHIVLFVEILARCLWACHCDTSWQASAQHLATQPGTTRPGLSMQKNMFLVRKSVEIPPTSGPLWPSGLYKPSHSSAFRLRYWAPRLVRPRLVDHFTKELCLKLEAVRNVAFEPRAPPIQASHGSSGRF